MRSRYETVAIVGVGLIGGSIGLALRQRNLAGCVVGIGRRQSSLRKAKLAGAIHFATTNLSRGVSEAELTIVCTPVARIAEHVRQVAEHCPDGAVITDAGSTKQTIVAALEGQLPDGTKFIGSHPLAGGHESGPEASRPDLFHERTVVVTATRRSSPHAVQAVTEFWQRLGAQVVRMSPSAHDKAVAATSHLPHLIASTLAAVTPKKSLHLAASGWNDTTRIAAGDSDMWQQIFLHNREELLGALDDFSGVLDAFRRALESKDAKAISRLLKKGKQQRDAMGS